MCVSSGVSVPGMIDTTYPVRYVTQKPSERMKAVGTSVIN